MNKIFGLLFLCVLLHTSSYTQPKMTLWLIQGSDSEHIAQHVPCGETYYSLVPEGQTEQESHWSIKNEGNTDLFLDLPLVLSGARSPNHQIRLQPAKGVLQPGEETFFTLAYIKSSDSVISSLQITSNDPSGQCTTYLDGGNTSPCRCYCNDLGRVEEICMTPGFIVPGDLLYEGTCTEGGYVIGSSCNSIPTLSEWGIIILGLFISIFGVAGVRERAIQTSS